MLADPHTGYELATAPLSGGRGCEWLPGPSVGEPVPGSQFPSVRSSADFTLMATGTARDSPRAPKVRLGLPDHAKTSDTCEKVRLGRFGSAKVLQSAQDATLRFGPLRIAKTLVHVCQNAKVTFCNFFIFENFSKIFTFSRRRLGVYFTDVC